MRLNLPNNVSSFFKSRGSAWLNKLPKRVASSALILENNIGQALIVKASYKSYWTFPGGIIEPGETPQEGAIRETGEEVGIAIDPHTVSFVAVVNRKSAIADTFQFTFTAPLSADMMSGLKMQPSEINEYALVTKAQVKSGDRTYGKVITHWAHNRSGYIEQTFDLEGMKHA